MRRRSETDRGHHPVRPRLVHGGAADIRSAGAGPAGFLGDGFLRPAKFRLLVRRHGRLRPLHQGSRQQCADRARRRRSASPPRPISPSCAASALSSSMASRRARCAPRCSRSAIPIWSPASRSMPWCGPAKARRHWPSARRSCRNFRQKTAGRSTRRSSIRSSTATIPARPRRKSSTPSPTPSPRSTIRSRPAPTSTCARGCRWSIRKRSRCRRSSCAANGTASPASRIWSQFFAKLPNPDKR